MPFVVFSSADVQDRGSFIFDKKTKSTLQKIDASCVDLDRCGSNTHLKYGLSFTANDRSKCRPPVTALQLSLSGLRHLTEGAGPGTASTISSRDVVFGLGSITRFLTDSMYSVDPVPPPTIGVGDSPLTPINRGKSYIFDNLNSGGYRLEIQRPQVYDVKDVCGLDYGRKGQVSWNLIGYDEDTCRPVLLAQNSIKIFASFAQYPTGISTISQLVYEDSMNSADAGKSMSIIPVLDSIDADAPPYDCATVTIDAFNIIQLGNPPINNDNGISLAVY